MSHGWGDAPAAASRPYRYPVRPASRAAQRHERLTVPRTWRDARDAAATALLLSWAAVPLALSWIFLFGRPR
jgi:hypothetical protein